MNWKERAKKLKTDVPAVFLAMKKKETPFSAKILAGITVCYALSPIDLIPDFIPVLGYLDDLLLLPVLVVLTVSQIPEPLMEECRKEAQGLWQAGKPKKWYYALPVAAAWLIVSILLIKWIWF